VPDRRAGVRLPKASSPSPLLAIGRRVGLAIGIVLLNWGIVIIERDHYTDNHDGDVSVTDALYYTTVTLTTTGYGDITPVTDGARLINALVVTPMRLLFVVVLVGTTIQALTERSREDFRLARWRARVKDHIVVLGYGTKGRNAIRALLLRGHPVDDFVVIDTNPQSVAEASAAGLVAVSGTATSQEVLREALVDRAKVVIVALERDDSAVLATLAVRRVAPQASVVAAARESEHAELLAQSGAQSVVVSSETAGRLLGLATDSPETVGVFEDLLSFGHGLDLVDRELQPEEVGRSPAELDAPVLAVVRDGRVLRYSDPAAGRLQSGDRVIYAEA